MARPTILLLVLPLLLSSCLFSPEPFDEGKWRNQVLSSDSSDLYAPHYRDGRFFNPWMVEEEGRFFKFLKWRLSSAQQYSDEEKRYLPEFRADLAERIKALEPSVDFLVWLGHASFLIRIDSHYWLTDPMLSERALLPARVTPPALSLEEVGTIPGPLSVIVSHNHYDHLDEKSIRALPDHARVIVPLGLQDFVQSLHDGEVEEMDWWQELQVDSASLTCLPAQHWSRRIGQGRNTTLWASYLIRAGGLQLYYGGDSGYFIGYREIGKRYPGIDYALLPTTAYHPRWFMHYPHINVEEALLAFDDLGAGLFIPTQWGTFKLGDNPPGYPMLELNRLVAKRGLEDKRFARLALGEILRLAH